MGLRITTQPHPSHGFLSPNPTQPDTPAWIVCPNWPDPLRACIVFLKGEVVCGKFTFSQFHLPQPGYEYVMQRHQVCVCPSPWSRQPDLSPHVNSDDSQQTIYNLQPARIVFYEMCFIKKEAWGPTRPAHLRIFSLRTLPPSWWNVVLKFYSPKYISGALQHSPEQLK